MAEESFFLGSKTDEIINISALSTAMSGFQNNLPEMVYRQITAQLPYEKLYLEHP